MNPSKRDGKEWNEVGWKQGERDLSVTQNKIDHVILSFSSPTFRTPSFLSFSSILLLSVRSMFQHPSLQQLSHFLLHPLFSQTVSFFLSLSITHLLALSFLLSTPISLFARFPSSPLYSGTALDFPSTHRSSTAMTYVTFYRSTEGRSKERQKEWKGEMDGRNEKEERKKIKKIHRTL